MEIEGQWNALEVGTKTENGRARPVLRSPGQNELSTVHACILKRSAQAGTA
jgi:hypothetical protein